MNMAVQSVVVAAVWIAVSVLVLWWLGASRVKPAAAKPGQLFDPASTLAAGLVGLAGVGWAAYAVHDGYTPPPWLDILLGAAALLSLVLIADYAFARHSVSAEGLRYGSVTGRRGELHWTELRRVTYAPIWKWFRLETASGKVARISAMNAGLPEFARLLLAHAPADAIDAKALPVLQSTAEGELPSLWR